MGGVIGVGAGCIVMIGIAIFVTFAIVRCMYWLLPRRSLHLPAYDLRLPPPHSQQPTSQPSTVSTRLACIAAKRSGAPNAEWNGVPLIDLCERSTSRPLQPGPCIGQSRRPRMVHPKEVR
jgi:hypothetical protein